MPTPPRPVVPRPVTDLAARQQGSSVILTFTLPKKSDENETLAALPSIEIFRGERNRCACQNDDAAYLHASFGASGYIHEGRAD